MNAYAISPKMLLVRDTPERIDFHIKSGDYFAFVATVLGFVEEGLDRCPGAAPERKLVQDLRKDLRYVHSRYSVRPKDS